MPQVWRRRAGTEQDHCAHAPRDRGRARLKWGNRDLVLAARARLGREPVRNGVGVYPRF